MDFPRLLRNDVVGQLVPAFMLIIGLVKGITAKTKVKTEER